MSARAAVAANASSQAACCRAPLAGTTSSTAGFGDIKECDDDDGVVVSVMEWCLLAGQTWTVRWLPEVAAMGWTGRAEAAIILRPSSRARIENPRTVR